MPATLTYPGVYIEELPSGVRTITDVATSIGAFVDFFSQGPMNVATQVLSFADFERTFDGLDCAAKAATRFNGSSSMADRMPTSSARAVRLQPTLRSPLPLPWKTAQEAPWC